MPRKEGQLTRQFYSNNKIILKGGEFISNGALCGNVSELNIVALDDLITSTQQRKSKVLPDP